MSNWRPSRALLSFAAFAAFCRTNFCSCFSSMAGAGLVDVAGGWGFLNSNTRATGRLGTLRQNDERRSIAVIGWTARRLYSWTAVKLSSRPAVKLSGCRAVRLSSDFHTRRRPMVSSVVVAVALQMPRPTMMTPTAIAFHIHAAPAYP